MRECCRCTRGLKSALWPDTSGLEGWLPRAERLEPISDHQKPAHPHILQACCTSSCDIALTTSGVYLVQTFTAFFSLPGMQPRQTSIAAAGAQAVCYYDPTLGG
jgi:hypothetical protein